jgi:hypothetical protein
MTRSLPRWANRQPPTRATSSLVRALRDARGSLLWTYMKSRSQPARNSFPSLCSIGRPSLRSDQGSDEQRAQRRSRLAEGQRRRRRGLDRASPLLFSAYQDEGLDTCDAAGPHKLTSGGLFENPNQDSSARGGGPGGRDPSTRSALQPCPQPVTRPPW